MGRLQIGMWHQFSKDDWNKYSSEMIKGIEISQYGNRNELEKAAAFCLENNISFGIHTPVFGNEKTLPEVTSLDPVTYAEAIKSVEEQVKVSADYGADYLLLHYPFPPIYATSVDRRYWDGPPNHAYYFSENVGRQKFIEVSERFFKDLSLLQNKYQQKIVLEYDFFGEYEDIFVSMFEKYQQIQLVIDTQRMEHHRRTFPGFDPYKWMDNIYQFIYLVHYSNVRFGENAKRHIPVLPYQDSDTNYGESYKFIEYLSNKSNSFHVTFEHNSTLVNRDELLLCFETVDKLIHTSKTPV